MGSHNHILLCHMWYHQYLHCSCCLCNMDNLRWGTESPVAIDANHWWPLPTSHTAPLLMPPSGSCANQAWSLELLWATHCLLSLVPCHDAKNLVLAQSITSSGPVISSNPELNETAANSIDDVISCNQLHIRWRSGGLGAWRRGAVCMYGEFVLLYSCLIHT